MNFECILKRKNRIEKWPAEFESFRKYDGYFEFVLLSKSVIHGIVGDTFRGKFICFPDFKVGCLIYNLDERYDNLEKLTKILNKVDAATVESALFYLHSYLNIKECDHCE